MAQIGRSGKTYGLIIPKTTKASATQGVRPRPSIFDDASDDETGDVKETIGSVGTALLQKKKYEARIKLQTQLEIDRALAQDPTCYEYDNVYDEMQEKKKVTDIKVATKADKKPKYIDGLMKAAEKRKREYERRVERGVQKEREKEGNEFSDKESFVTSAYKKKMEEMQAEEERAKREEEREAILDVTKQKDMSGFYRYLYKETTATPTVPDNSDAKRGGENATARNSIKADKSDSDSDSSYSDERSSGSTNWNAKRNRSSSLNQTDHKNRRASRSPESVYTSSNKDRNAASSKRYVKNRSRSPLDKYSEDRSKHTSIYSSNTKERNKLRSRSNSREYMPSTDKKNAKSPNPHRSKKEIRGGDRSHRYKSPRQDRFHSSCSRSPDDQNKRKGSDKMLNEAQHGRERLKPEHSRIDKGSRTKNDSRDSQISGADKSVGDKIAEESSGISAKDDKYARQTSESVVEEARAKYLARKQARQSIAPVTAPGD